MRIFISESIVERFAADLNITDNSYQDVVGSLTLHRGTWVSVNLEKTTETHFYVNGSGFPLKKLKYEYVDKIDFGKTGQAGFQNKLNENVRVRFPGQKANLEKLWSILSRQKALK